MSLFRCFYPPESCLKLARGVPLMQNYAVYMIY